jgi:hypothetical protein
LYIDIAVIVHIEQVFVGVWILLFLLAVRPPNVAFTLTLETCCLLLETAKLVACITVVLVVVIRCLQDRVVLCLHVACTIDGHIFVESIVQILI